MSSLTIKRAARLRIGRDPIGPASTTGNDERPSDRASTVAILHQLGRCGEHRLRSLTAAALARPMRVRRCQRKASQLIRLLQSRCARIPPLMKRSLGAPRTDGLCRKFYSY